MSQKPMPFPVEQTIMASLPSPTLLSVEKKRARDRRAQRNFRHRKIEHIATLQSELRACREEVVTYQARIRDLENICSCLREQNSQLIQSSSHDAKVASVWQTDVLYPNRDSLHSTNQPLIGHCPSGTCQGFPGDPCRCSTCQTSTDEFTHALRNTASPSSQGVIAPLWSLTPPQNLSIWNNLPTIAPRVGDLQATLESPEYPSPLELLYGSRTNKLANLIHDTTRVWRCCEPERLAGGWLAYLFAKWLAEPTKPRFERLPEFLKPGPEQLRHVHPDGIDGVVFPQLRINLISMPHLYDLDSVLRMLSCCLKVRWPWGKNFLTPGGLAELFILPEFYNTFMSLDGWGLTEEFINEYPELLNGMDVQKVLYRVG